MKCCNDSLGNRKSRFRTLWSLSCLRRLVVIISLIRPKRWKRLFRHRCLVLMLSRDRSCNEKRLCWVGKAKETLKQKWGKHHRIYSKGHYIHLIISDNFPRFSIKTRSCFLSAVHNVFTRKSIFIPIFQMWRLRNTESWHRAWNRLPPAPHQRHSNTKERHHPKFILCTTSSKGLHLFSYCNTQKKKTGALQMRAEKQKRTWCIPESLYNYLRLQGPSPSVKFPGSQGEDNNSNI